MSGYDFTHGSIFKHLVFFSAPIMLTNLLQTSYQFIDSLWVGNLLGAEALGAVAVSSTVIFTVLSFIIGINNATLTILSQQKGRKDEEGLRTYLNAFVVILAVLALILGTAGYFLSGLILQWMGTPENMLPGGTVYLQIHFLGIVFLIGYNFVSTVLRALGDSKTPVRIVLAAVILNTVLDPLFIAGLGLGIAGAAAATLVSQGAAFLLGLWIVLQRKLAPFSIPWIPAGKEVRLILKLGIPAGLQMMVISAGVMAIMSVVNSFGSDVVAGYGAAQRLDSLIMLPASALGTAVNSMAGQNIGANKWDRVRKIGLYGVLYNLAIMFSIAVVVFLSARYGIQMFIREEEAVRFGAEYLQIIAFMYPFLGINFVLNGIVRASGAMFQVLVLNFVSFWILRFPLTYLLSGIFGEIGIAYGVGVSFMISSMISFLYYRYGKWRKKELFEASSV